MPKRLPEDMVDIAVFNGVTFRRYPQAKQVAHQRYYSPGGTDRARGVESLHREVWKARHGPIPAGFDIHHKDDDPLNNAVDNLECIHPDDHKALHEEDGKWSGSIRVREHLSGIQRLAADWHASQEGILWHRAHGRAAYAKRPLTEFSCGECGKSFLSKHKSSCRPDGKRFCSERCQGAMRRREGRQLRSLRCSQCGSEYQGIGRGTTCSKKCAADLRWAQTGRRKE